LSHEMTPATLVGNKNALKHGAYTKAAEERRAAMRKLFAAAKEILEEIE
jgi:hypothetical protein